MDLFAGKANIYFNGTFIGESFINPAEVNDTLDVSLGRDKNIIIKRIKKKELSSKQLIGPNKKETYVYEIAVKNNSEGSINLELADQIPVSLDSEIVVEKLSSNGAFFNELEGLLTWELQLQPKQSKTIEFSFSIKYPKNKPLKSEISGMRSLRYF